MSKIAHDDLLTREELAERLGVSPITIGLWSRQGKIPTRRFSHKVVRYSLEAVVSALEKGHSDGLQATAPSGRIVPCA